MNMRGPEAYVRLSSSAHRRPPVRPARAPPAGRAQQAEPDRRTGEETTQASQASAGVVSTVEGTDVGAVGGADVCDVSRPRGRGAGRGPGRCGGGLRSADRSTLRIRVSRTVADTVSNSYGSEGWEFEPLRARRSEVVHALGPSLWVSMGLEFSSDRR
jgi:hypothetical protein